MSFPTANGGERPRSTDDSQRLPNGRVPRLRLRIVDTPGNSSRATLYPTDAADIDRMETWLTVDTSVVRDLSACR